MRNAMKAKAFRLFVRCSDARVLHFLCKALAPTDLHGAPCKSDTH